MTYLGNSPGLTNYTVAVEVFSGNAACTEFQLAQNIADANAIDVRVSSVPQDPTTAYTLAAGLITFTGAPPNAANNIVQIMKKNKEPIKIKTFHIEPDGIDKLDENDKLDAIMGSYKTILDKYKKSISQ